LKKKYKISYLAIVLVLMGLTLSCAQDETCRDDKQASFQIGFADFETGRAASVDSLQVFVLDADGQPMDSVLNNKQARISTLKLPLNKTANTTVFILQFLELYNDTLYVFYENTEYFISYPCGMTIAHQLDTVISSNHVIKDLKILQKKVDTNEMQHVQILL